MLRRALERGGYARPIDVSSTRAGSIPGTHTVGLRRAGGDDRRSTHTVRDRATFAHGALEAARWVVGPARAGSRCGTCSGSGELRGRRGADGDANAVHGLRDGAGHAVHGVGRARRGRRPPAGAAADRRRRALPRAVRHDRRGADALAGREAPRRRDRGRGGGRAACPSSPAPAATTRARSSRRRARCSEAGADGLLSVTPYYNKPTPEGLFRHYQAIAEATPLPIVVYNVPGRTGCNVDPATLARLAAIPHVVGVKEASGNMTQICEVAEGGAPRASSSSRATTR